MPKYEPILDILQKRIDDPNYKPTGPTYGEVMPEHSAEELERQLAIVNWNRAIAQERERCARIAEDYASGDSSLGHALNPSANISATIRRGK